MESSAPLMTPTESSGVAVKMIAVLCVSRNSVYKQIKGVDSYDEDRDARTFPGGIPAVAHPPCRCYSAFCRHQAKPKDRESEMALGVWCVDQVRKWGGVIEQPAHSKLWETCGLPQPKDRNAAECAWSMELPQFWFGDVREKNTWLFFSRIPRADVPKLPFRLKPEGGDRRAWQLMSSKNQREKTPMQFAQWLVECARRCEVTS
jgi:hypothetical protein